MKLIILILLAVVSIATAQLGWIDEQTLIQQHRIAIGMSMQGVQRSWGLPDEINTIMDATGANYYWYYHPNTIVIIRNGVVLSFGL